MNRRLLVMDDEPDLIELYKGILAPHGTARGNLALAPKIAPYDVVTASSGEEALAQIEANLEAGTPLIGGFFDMRMGSGIDGVETIRRAKDMDPNLLCVIVTGHSDRGIDEIHDIFGPDYADRWDFMVKPFSGTEISQKARNLVTNWERRKREKEYLYKIESQQEQLVRAERLAALGTMARGLGHEFGNILHTILGKADIALVTKNPEKMEAALAAIIGSAERAGVLVRNLQSLVKMDSTREQISLEAPLREALQLLEFEIKKGRVRLVEEGIATLPTIKINRVEISQAFLNIVLNAVQAMEAKGGELRIRVVREGEMVGVEFKDSGSGISAEDLPKIFEPLFTTKVGRGSGIGLSVSRRVIENHNGRITVKSEVGKGSEFTTWFPA